MWEYQIKMRNDEKLLNYYPKKLLISKKSGNFAEMFEIDRHIEILLLKHNCVIIPGFGGFVAHHISSRYDEIDGMLLPPMRTVGFNPQLTLNDSLLVQSYIEAYGISYPEALRQIESEVAEMKMRIERDGYIEICSVGKIFINNYGQYEFEPCLAGLLTPELYGMPGVEISTLNNEHKEIQTPAESVEEEPKVKVIPISSLIEEEPKESAATVEEELIIDETVDEDDDNTTIGSAAWYKLAVACALLLIAFSVPFAMGTDTMKNISLSGIDVSFLQRFIPENIISAKQESPVQNVAIAKPVEKPAVVAPEKVENTEVEPVIADIVPENKENSITIDDIVSPSVEKPAIQKVAPQQKTAPTAIQKEIKNTQAKTIAKKNEAIVASKSELTVQKAAQTKPITPKNIEKKTINITYTIVLSSGTNNSFAEEYVKELHSRGYIAARIFNSGSQIRVVHGKYASYEDASQMRENLQQLPEFEKCWVLEVVQ